MTQLNLLGSALGRFEIISELGSGGMAVVYKARQIDLDRIVALKVLPPELSYDTTYIERFRQEARRAASLEHPHIVPIYDIGEANSLHYIAMKYVEGQTLKDVMHQTGALPVPQVAEILSQVGEALDYAHRRGVIHRDIKPTNIMITDDGWVYLTDFGLARDMGGAPGLTRTGTVMGTPEYMSPEQAQGLHDIGPATDIYALGIVLYEALTGTAPFQADTPMAMMAARLVQEPRPIHEARGDLPLRLEEVVMRALARDPSARFGSAHEMVLALRMAADIAGATGAQRPITPRAGVTAADDVTLAGMPQPRQADQAEGPPSTPPFVLPPVTGETVAAREQEEPVPVEAAGTTGPTERIVDRPHCPACDTINPQGAVFCVNCGRSLAGEGSDVTRPEGVPEPRPAPPVRPAQPPPPPVRPAPSATPSHFPDAHRPKAKPARRARSLAWGGASGGIFLIGLAILFLTNTFWPGILVLLGITGFLSSAAGGRPWAGVSTAVFFIGLAIIAATDTWWPGILVLLGISFIIGALRRPDRRGW